ncbi:MAG: hypothetical protein ACREOJ_05715 [Gemmatimonadaceae bacterium]
MEDPPAAPQDEFFQIIGELESLSADLQGVNAEVSIQLSRILERLRVYGQRMRSAQARRLGWVIVRDVLRALAVEVVKRIIETSISSTPGPVAREPVYRSYDSRRLHKDASRFGWAQAA